MRIVFEFKQSPYIHTEQVCVIGDFNFFEPTRGIMQKEDDIWKLEMNIPYGEHKYKFLLDGEIELNDPMADDYVLDDLGNVWSSLVINEQDEREYVDETYSLHLEDYILTSRNLEETETMHINKRVFNLGVDKMASARLEFNHVIGVHEVEVLWYMPNGSMYSYGTETLYESDNPEESTYLWFYIPFADIDKVQAEGIWKLKLIIDGNYILEDSFNVQNGISYGLYGNGLIRDKEVNISKWR